MSRQPFKPISAASCPTGPPGGITSRSLTPWAAARCWMASKRRREAQSQNLVAVKSATTTVVPETSVA